MIALLALAAGLLVLGADATVRGARSFGLRVGLSPVVAGLTIVAYGASAPELFVSSTATLDGQDGIALGNAIGSNIANILLILGLCALIRPLETHARLLRVEAPLLVACRRWPWGCWRWGAWDVSGERSCWAACSPTPSPRSGSRGRSPPGCRRSWRVTSRA